MTFDSKDLIVYAIERNGAKKKYWRKVGRAVLHPDGAIIFTLTNSPLLMFEIRERGMGIPGEKNVRQQR